MILDPNGMPILQPTVDNAETATFNDAFAAVGNAVVAVENVRQIQTYKWADNAARTAQTGMTAGDEGYQTDTDTYYTYDGTAWITGTASNLQLDTTNSVATMVTQYGMGKVVGDDTNEIAKVVTFPVAFSTVPVVQANMLGNKLTGAFPNPVAGLSSDTRTFVNGQQPTTTTMAVRLTRITGTHSSSYDFYYSWSATGVLA